MAAIIGAFNYLTDPGLRDFPGSFRYAFDSTAAFGPDGTAYVLYGGEDSRVQDHIGLGTGELYRMTLAASKDNGLTWSYHIVNDLNNGLATIPDYMDLAVAPDSGRLIVVAQASPPVNLIELWTSDDGGKTWQMPRIAVPFVEAAATSFAPRITAAAGGLVVLSMKALVGADPNAPGNVSAYVVISRDGGKSWAAPVRLHTFFAEGTGINDPAGIWEDASGTHIAAVYGDGNQVFGYRSDDLGKTWQGPSQIGSYAAGASHIWLSVAADAGGTVYAQTRSGQSNNFFGIDLFKWAPDGSTDSLSLVGAVADGSYTVGDDYGAAAVAADGAVWTAWSDRRSGIDKERIAVTRVMPN